jgi:hypothetical protein
MTARVTVTTGKGRARRFQNETFRNMLKGISTLASFFVVKFGAGQPLCLFK